MSEPTRRRFVQAVGGAIATGAVLQPSQVDAADASSSSNTSPGGAPPADARRYWLNVTDRIATPVLAALSQRKLKATMPVEAHDPKDRGRYTHLEALGRLLFGIAPLLETGDDAGDEGKLRDRLRDQARAGVDAATDPKSPDFMNFNHGAQPLVDAAFLAQAMLRAPTQLWDKLDQGVQKNLIAALASSRVVRAFNNNWVLFSAMIEAAMARFGQPWHREPIQTALDKHMQWYVGDGTYGDGPHYHWDYYNSFVIQPMLIDVLDTVAAQDAKWKKLLPTVLRRAHRYAAVQERLIGPEGSYPPIGRSLCYRFGAFQVLAQIAWREELPHEVTPAQVRCALTAVIHRQIEMPGTFDAAGFLRIGFAGHQPAMAHHYISTGSLYLCSAALLPLGLKPAAPFWHDPAADWTAKKAWSGAEIPPDHAVD